MNHKINLQARIKRHSRILKDNLGNSLHHGDRKQLGHRIVSAIIILMFPFYPMFTSFVYSNTELDFYRGDIDESSILESYDTYAFEEDNEILFESKDSYLSVGTLMEDDMASTNKMVRHTVEDNETITLLAKKYGISADTIRWNNNLDKKAILKKGEILIFPPVTGVVHKVKSGETVSAIAHKYGIAGSSISKQNLLRNNVIHAGKKLVIPGGKYIKEVEKIVPVKKAYASNKKYYAKKYTAPPKSSYTTNTGKYKLKWRKPYSGAWGNCTYYVASYKNVNWRGNANQWMRNARAKGHATGSNAKVGSIISFAGRGYNPRYGHVGIVMEVQKNHLIVSDMNYRRINQVTYRKISRWDKTIKGYIYVK